MSSRRKIFVKTDQTIPIIKHERTVEDNVVILDIIPPANTVVTFPPEVKRRTFDFSPWYGVGIDQITFACQRQVERFLVKQDAEVTAHTVVAYCTTGLKYFLPHVTLLSSAIGSELKLKDITKDLIHGFISSLENEETERITKKNRYQATKSVLKALCKRGLIQETRHGDDATFPDNPFPGADRQRKGEKPLPASQRKALNVALRDAVRPLFFLDSSEITSYLLGCAVLLIGLQTGRNTTPLLEMTPNCLRPHPKEKLSFLVLYKRRGHSTNKVVVRDTHDAIAAIADMPTLQSTASLIVRRLFVTSEALRSQAPVHFKDRILLYRMRASGNGTSKIGQVQALSEGTLAKAISTLVKTYNLKDKDGRPLRVNLSRLRKTFVNRVFELTERDMVATATAAGNSVAVTSTNYLRPDESSQLNWKFMGRALTDGLLSGDLSSSEKTPIGRCSDIKNGDYAPKNSSDVCMSFLNCVRCRSYVVTGDDLYRTFSFYWSILRERTKLPKSLWRKQYAHIVRLIERDVVEAGLSKGVFNPEVVKRERERARIDPHPFWRSDTTINDIKELSA